MICCLSITVWGQTVNVLNFSDLQNAISQLPSGGTINVTTNAITVNADLNLTSANPVTINVSKVITVTNATLTIGNNVTVTATTGSAITASTGGNVVTNTGCSISGNTSITVLVSGGTLSVNGGTITNTTASGTPRTVQITNGGICIINNGGTVSHAYSGARTISIENTGNGGKLYITGGIISSGGYAIQMQAGTGYNWCWISGSPTISTTGTTAISMTTGIGRLYIATKTATFSGNISSSNSSVINNFANTTAITPNISSGTYSSSQIVSLSGGTDFVTQYTATTFTNTYAYLIANGTTPAGGVALKYTTDGTDPTPSSSTYSSSLTIPTSTKLKVAPYILPSSSTVGVVSTFNYYISPVWTTNYPALDLQTTSGFRAKVSINEPGKSYYVVLPKNASEPSPSQVKAGQDASGTSLASYLIGTISCSAASTEYTSSIVNLPTHATSTDYDVYFVAEDANSTLQASVTKVTTSTLALSSVADPLSVSSAVISQTQINVLYTPNGSNNNVLIAYNSSGTFGTPVNGKIYNTNDTIANSATTIIYKGGSSPFNHSSLSPATTYYYKVWSVDGSNNYSTGLPTYNTTFAAEPTTQASGITFSGVTQTGMTIGWTSGNGANRLVLVKESGAVDNSPIDGTTYTSNTIFKNGTQIGSGNYVVYNSNGSSVAITGLTAGTNYNIAIFEFNGSAGTYNYLTSNSATSSQYSMYSAPSAPTNLTFSPVTSNSLKASFTAPTPAPNGYLVLRRTNNAVGSTPVAGVTYTQGTTFGSDDVVYVGATAWNGYDQTGLSDNTAYSYAVYSYNGSGQATNYSAALINVGITNTITVPISASATNTSSIGFTANWAAVSGATSYKLDVSTSSNFPFEESFERCKLGTETAACTDFNYSIGNNVDNFMHSTGWTSWFIFQAGGSLYLGYGTNASAITTPTLNLTGTFTLTFDCKTYNSGTATTYGAYLSTDNGTTFNQVGTSLTSQSGWTNVSFQITGGNATSKIKIAKNNDTKLILIDNIRIYQTDNLASFNNLTVNGTSQSVTGLSPNTTYYYRVRALDATGASLNSATQTATTGATSTVSSSITSTNLGLSSSTTANDITVQPGVELTIDNPTSVHAITVNSGGKLTLLDGNSLSANSLTLQTDISGKVATFVDQSTSNFPSINANVSQFLTSGRNWYVSSPITTATTGALSSATTVVSYNEPTGGWITESGSLNPLKGYISATTNASGPIAFSGILNTGTQTITLTRSATNASKPGFNLVGNPYPSYVKWGSAITSNLDPTIWFRTKFADGHAYTFDTYNSTSKVGTANNGTTVSDSIPPMQAFWVRVSENQTSGSLTFNNSMRTHKGVITNLLKAPAATKSEQQLVRLQVSNGISSDEAIVLINPNAQNTFDAYDSPKMTNATAAIPEIFTVAGNHQLVINGLNSIASDEELPLGFTTGQTNTFSIKATEISNFDAGTSIMLRDRVLNTEQDITDGSAYSFTSDPTTANTSRFSLVFKSPSTTTGFNSGTDDKNISVYRNANNQITINYTGSLSSASMVTVSNAVGQKLVEKNMTSTISVIDNRLLPGLYLVSVTTAGKSITKKVILN